VIAGRLDAERSVPPARDWNSWHGVYPAEFWHLSSGVKVGVAAYAGSRNSFTRFAPGTGVVLGPRRIDGSRMALTLRHAGTEIELSIDKPAHHVLRGRWRATKLGEWGLRFWLLLCLRWEPPGELGAVSWRYLPQTGHLVAERGATHAMALAERLPLLTTFHDTPGEEPGEGFAALAGELETQGYFYLASQGGGGRFAVMRFNLEEMAQCGFAVGVGGDPSDLVSQLRDAIAAPPSPAPPDPAPEGPFAGALEAVRDVVGWNTVWDSINCRPYTSLSRNWVAQKFGGFGVWLDDIFYHALMAGAFDGDVARENLEAVLAGAQPAGNLPCLLTGNDAWVDRSQPPIGAFIVWMLYQRWHDRGLLTLAYRRLLANHEWWWRTRDGNGDGLVEYGTSPVGGGLYRGTKLAAKDESSMDNSPVHDEARLVPDQGTLDCADVGLNSLLALDGEMLALIARELGEAADAEGLDRRAAELRERIAERLWDESRQVFANRLWSGRFVKSLAPTSFYPMIAGAARPEQAAAMVHLLQDVRKFGGTWLLPSVTRDDPAFDDNVYWRGRIWPPLNFLVWHGLRRYGFEREARMLADNGWRLFQGEWRRHRRCPENFNSVTGAALDQPDTDSFYGWGALMPWLAAAEIADFNPWQGWTVAHDGEPFRHGPFQSPAGPATFSSQGGILTLTLNGAPSFATNLRGRLIDVEIDAGRSGLTLPPIRQEGFWIEFPRREIVMATLDGHRVATADGRIVLLPTRAANRLEVRFA
jgi:putative isomerase